MSWTVCTPLRLSSCTVNPTSGHKRRFLVPCFYVRLLRTDFALVSTKSCTLGKNRKRGKYAQIAHNTVAHAVEYHLQYHALVNAQALFPPNIPSIDFLIRSTVLFFFLQRKRTFFCWNGNNMTMTMARWHYGTNENYSVQIIGTCRKRIFISLFYLGVNTPPAVLLFYYVLIHPPVDFLLFLQLKACDSPPTPQPQKAPWASFWIQGGLVSWAELDPPIPK